MSRTSLTFITANTFHLKSKSSSEKVFTWVPSLSNLIVASDCLGFFLISCDFMGYGDFMFYLDVLNAECHRILVLHVILCLSGDPASRSGVYAEVNFTEKEVKSLW